MKPKSRQDLLDRLGIVVESRWARTLLMLLIIVSVLPYREIEEGLRPLFLVAFGAEISVRVLLLGRRLRRRARSGSVGPSEGERGRPIERADYLFLAIDIAALVSFLPLVTWLGGRGGHPIAALTVLRLTRLLVLIRFSRELVSDVYSILTRREQLQQFTLVTVVVAVLAFVSAVVLDQLGLELGDAPLGQGERGFWERMWWSFRQLESSDNLVPDLAGSPFVIVLSLGLTITGVFIVSFIIGIGTNVVEQVVRSERRRPVGYVGHTVIVGAIAESEILIREFVRIYIKNRRGLREQLRETWSWMVRGAAPPRRFQLPRMGLLGSDDEPPACLYEPGMRWVVYRQGDGTHKSDLALIGAGDAKRAILLAHPDAGRDADAVTLATLAAFRSLNPEGHAFVELNDRRNRATLLAIGGAGRTFALDIHRFLGLFLLHHLVIPGVERLYHYLLTAEGAEFYTHIYVEPDELGALDALRSRELPCDRLDRMAMEAGVTVIGVFLGDDEVHGERHGLIPLTDLVQWLNPHDQVTDPRVRALGGAPGRIPLRSLRGILAIGESYTPVRRFAQKLLHDLSSDTAISRRARSDGSRWDRRSSPEIEIASLPPWWSALRLPAPPVRRILVIGLGVALPSLLGGLSRLVPGCVVRAVVDASSLSDDELERELADWDLPIVGGGELRHSELPQGGELELHIERRGDAMAAALELAGDGRPIDAVVFLSERSVNSDARVGLRVMRFVEAYASGRVCSEACPHILAEFVSLTKGGRIRSHAQKALAAGGREGARMTVISTEQIRNYFMVHSAFVPGAIEIYAMLLSEVGQDIIRLPIDPGRARPSKGGGREGSRPGVSFLELSTELAKVGVTPIALHLASGEVVLNPGASRRYAIADLAGVFAIGDPDELPLRFAELEGEAEEGAGGEGAPDDASE